MININKIKIENSQERISIIVSPKNNWILLLWGLTWLNVWVFSFIFGTIRFFFHHKEAIVHLMEIIWLIIWLIGGFAMTLYGLWMFFRQEKFIADKHTVSFEKTLFGIGKKQQLESSEIRNIRLNSNIWINSNVADLGKWGVKFDYKLKTFSLTLGLDKANAQNLITIMNDFFKSNQQ